MTTGVVFAGDEPIRAGADHFRHLCVRVRAREAFRHHERQRCVGFADRRGQQRERAGQADFDGAVVRRAELLNNLRQCLAERFALGPTLNTRGAVAREHRRPVMELQAVAQTDTPRATVVGDLVPFRHLRFRPTVRTAGVKCVENVVGMVVRHRRCGEDRVE